VFRDHSSSSLVVPSLLSPSRRALLKAGLFGAAIASLSPFSAAAARLALFSDYPFKLGVASGTPTADGFVIWTRLCPDPLHGGGMGVQQVVMRWEVATDEHFANVVKSGTWTAMAGLAHSAHVPVTGLPPDRWYFYRFLAGNEVSPTGRTRTLPAATQDTSRLRFALASCQHFELGYFSSYRHMLKDDVDLVAFVGDYIYEYTASSGRVRQHANDEPYSLQSYRDRYAQYKLDADLQAMHHAAPWLLTIDDHEVANDWAGDISEDLDPNFPERRGNALQAYFEHQPLPMSALLPERRLQVYGETGFGRLAQFHILDDRQYRDPEVCPHDGMGGSNFNAPDRTCPERKNPQRTILGSKQEAWLDGSLAKSKARWDIVVQESLVSPLPAPGRDGLEFFTDAWDGYPAARDRLVHSLHKHEIRNPLIVGGDYHCTIACDVKADYGRPDSATIGTEIVGTSLTSPGMPQSVLDERIKTSPHARFSDSDHRGYVLFDLSDKGLDIAMRSMTSITTHDADCTTTRRFHVEEGHPGLQDA
jgi:alkaline phosphatase D